MREVRCWTAVSEATLQDVLSDVARFMLQCSSENISESVEVLTSLIPMLVNDNIRIDGCICAALGRHAAATSHTLRYAVKVAQRLYSNSNNYHCTLTSWHIP